MLSPTGEKSTYVGANNILKIKCSETSGCRGLRCSQPGALNGLFHVTGSVPLQGSPSGAAPSATSLSWLPRLMLEMLSSEAGVKGHIKAGESQRGYALFAAPEYG